VKARMADWGGGMSACCKPWVQLFTDMDNGWPHSAPRYHWLMPISCHFQDCHSASVQKSISCKKRYSEYWTLPFLLLLAARNQHLKQ